jgi:hypothetical protein
VPGIEETLRYHLVDPTFRFLRFSRLGILFRSVAQSSWGRESKGPEG